MPLAQTVDSLDVIPEAARGAYVKDEVSGKFVLDFAVEDTTGLKSALANERKANKALKDLTAKYESLGLSHDEIQELITKDTAAATEALRKKGDVEGILKQHQTKWDTERNTLVSERDSANNAARTAIVDSALLGALGKANALLDVEGTTEFLTDRLGKRVDLKIVNGKPVHRIMSADGETPMAGSGADGLATYEDLVKEAVKAYPFAFKGTGAGGGGAPKGGGGPAGEKTISRADFDKLPANERMGKMRGGFKLID